MDKGKANHRTPPQETGPSAKLEKRGAGPAGSGWLVARVPVAGSTITIGPQSETPHNRPASRSQSFVTSSKYCLATCGWTCASATVAAPGSTSRNSAFRVYRVFLVIFPPEFTITDHGRQRYRRKVISANPWFLDCTPI